MNSHATGLPGWTSGASGVDNPLWIFRLSPKATWRSTLIFRGLASKDRECEGWSIHDDQIRFKHSLLPCGERFGKWRKTMRIPWQKKVKNTLHLSCRNTSKALAVKGQKQKVLKRSQKVLNRFNVPKFLPLPRLSWPFHPWYLQGASFQAKGLSAKKCHGLS